MYTVIDNDGFIVDYCVNDNYKCKNNQQKVKQYLEFNTLKLVKPRWNGAEWIEGATEEEIKAWKNKNKINIESSLEERISLLEDTINYLILGGNQ